MLVRQGRGQSQNGNGRHCQRLQFILEGGGNRDGRNRNGRRVWFGAALRRLTVPAISAAGVCHRRLRGDGRRRQDGDGSRRQDKSQQQRDYDSSELQCHACSFQSLLKRNDTPIIAEPLPNARILFRVRTSSRSGVTGRNLKLAAGLRLRVQSWPYEQYSCVDDNDV
jgi:hypothetical protein